ncbi:chemotaxis-specific protein-glutamate methyltransferase CheB [Andreprevotia chitinilytica]|uniref:chemotaxis-specific protein-glutamate methyltransferase CheB n=1 Tax=Andreprevotia chitinilytica TaxID=396808 RepID=UPI000A8FCA0A|nr:chemotaxis-specific protein-glutamate methyltransferase CheB [Andreprevotia chitinilytica]
MYEPEPATAARAMIRVLVVDDSPSARELLVYVLNTDPAIQVIGVASSGEQAVEMAAKLKPDVITMDIHMPGLDGFGATRRIMESCPTRIVMVTAVEIPGEVAATFSALDAGALAVLARPVGIGLAGFEADVGNLLQTIKLMSEVNVVRRWPQRAAKTPATPATSPPVSLPSGDRPIRIVAIGASTGGPMVLQTIFSQLPADFPVPIVLVQHISAGFAVGFAQWLASTTGFPVRVAQHREPLRAGTVYLAPDHCNMRVCALETIALTNDPPEHGLRPSVSCLFRSVAEVYQGTAAGVLLTGMGRDGAQELLQMKETGAVTIAQDKESAVVFGMPGEAVKLGGANYVLAPDMIAAALRRLVTTGR